jgi:hypothetical protein
MIRTGTVSDRVAPLASMRQYRNQIKHQGNDRIVQDVVETAHQSEQDALDHVYYKQQHSAAIGTALMLCVFAR